MRTITTDERRARLGVRHHLATSAGSVVEAARDLVGLHSSDPATVHLSAFARVDDVVVGDVERALYEDRSLLRVPGMRKTVFVVPSELAAVLHAACASSYVASDRRRLVRMLEAQGIAEDGEAWVRGVERRTLERLNVRGEATASELRADMPELTESLRFGEGKPWGGFVGVSTRVLFLLAASGEIVRTRPKGSWISSQYRWATFGRWTGEPLPSLDPQAARADVTRRWLSAFGPGTLDDLKWWTGWTVAGTRAALAAVDAVEVGLEDGVGFVLPNDVDEAPVPDDWVALLPSLDPTTMGWKERNWYVGDHAPWLFDRNGNAGPTIWWNGRVVGGWTQRKGSGEIVCRLLEQVPDDVGAAIGMETERLRRWLADVRVTPRFTTPLDRELRG